MPQPALSPSVLKVIVPTAIDSGSFKPAAVAITAAGLGGTLLGTGPFTVFAPTDAAFAKLAPGTVEALLKDLPKLTAILTYHVVSGRHLAADVASLKTATTVQGGTLKIAVNGGKVMINNAEVVAADVLAANGVIHVIDSVLLPS